MKLASQIGEFFINNMRGAESDEIIVRRFPDGSKTTTIICVALKLIRSLCVGFLMVARPPRGEPSAHLNTYASSPTFA
jgi:hypothetical protein